VIKPYKEAVMQNKIRKQLLLCASSVPALLFTLLLGGFALNAYGTNIYFKRVYADVSSWQSTGVYANTGDTLVFVACGKVVHWQSRDKTQKQYCGPDGVPGTTNETVYLAPGLIKMGLVGRIGNHFFNIGSSRTVRAPTSGYLYLGMNDTVYYGGCADNEGYWTVGIVLIRR